MGSLKRLLTCVFSAVFILTMTVGVFAAEINVDERRILNSFKEEPFKTRLDKKYINQFENYFSMDNVNIEKPSADAFIQYFSKAVVEYKNSGGKGEIFSQSDVSFEYFQYAGEAIGIYLEYDSNTNSFYGVDNAGYVVIDSQKIIKDTGEDSKVEEPEGKSFGISIVNCIVHQTFTIGSSACFQIISTAIYPMSSSFLTRR